MLLLFYVTEGNDILVVYKKVMKKFIKKYSGMILFMGFTIGFVLLLTYIVPKSNKPFEGIPHNYWVPTKEDKDWTGTPQGEDTITVTLSDTINVKINRGDTIEVSATMYYPVVGQCDDTPDITADQSKIPNIDSCSHLNWIAVSQDLLWFNGGPLRYGDTVYVVAGRKTGEYIVRDAMNKRFKFKIDFLESVGTELYSFDDVKMFINS